jgi:predicted DCC family thiol-disulfide oxidoreductase YuxK
MTPANLQWTVEVFYDGECPLCMREIDMLMKRDRRGRIKFTNIAEPSFDPASVGFDMATMMAKIHGRLPTGEWIEGVEVFRQLYTAIGFGPLVALSRIRGVSDLLEVGYRWFAKNRLRLTGRCVDGACALPTHA